MDWLQIIVAAVSAGGLTQVLNSFFNIRKNNAQVKTSELDNIEKAVKIWRTLSEEQYKKVNVLERELSELRNQVRVMDELQKKKCSDCKYKIYYQQHHDKHTGD